MSSAALVQGGTYAKGESVIDPMGNVGVVKYDASTGKPLASGQKTTTPVAKPVTVLSSNAGKAAIDPMVTQQKTDEANLAAAAASKSAAAGTGTANPPEDSYTYDDLQTAGADMNNYTLDKNSGTYVLKPDAPGSSEAAINKKYTSDLSDIDKTFKMQQDSYDTAQNAVYDSINGIYKQLADEQRDANKRQYASYENMGIRDGGTRYAGEITQGLLNSEERAGLGRLQDIAAKQAAALADAKSAAATQSWTIFAAKRKEMNDLSTQRQKELDDLRTSAQKRLDEARKIRQASIDAATKGARDSKIADIVSEGVTDPKKVLSYLNYDHDGNQIGDYTIKEVGDALDTLIPKPTKAGGAGPAVNKITLSEARTSGLPLSVVGMSEQEIASSFSSSNPPEWFRQSVEGKQRMNLTPKALQSQWDTYVSQYNANGGSSKSTPKVSTATDYTDRASAYFKATYGDKVDEATAKTLAEAVQQYVDGGMTYAKAVQQVEADAS